MYNTIVTVCARNFFMFKQQLSFRIFCRLLHDQLSFNIQLLCQLIGMNGSTFVDLVISEIAYACVMKIFV
jgi:hypothetical protein